MESLIGSGAFVELGGVDTYSVRITQFGTTLTGAVTQSQTAAEALYNSTVAKAQVAKVELLKNGVVIKSWTKPSTTKPSTAVATRKFQFFLYNKGGEKLYMSNWDYTDFEAAKTGAKAKAATMPDAETAKVYSDDGGGGPGMTGFSFVVTGAGQLQAVYSFTVDDAATGKRYYSSGNFYASGDSQSAAITKAASLAEQYGANMKYSLLQNGKVVGGDTVATKKAPALPPVSPLGEPPAQPPAQPVIPVPPQSNPELLQYTENTQTPVTAKLEDTSVVTNYEGALDNQYVRAGILAAVGVGVIGTLYVVFGRRK